MPPSAWNLGVWVLGVHVCVCPVSFQREARRLWCQWHAQDSPSTHGRMLTCTHVHTHGGTRPPPTPPSPGQARPGAPELSQFPSALSERPHRRHRVRWQLWATALGILEGKRHGGHPPPRGSVQAPVLGRLARPPGPHSLNPEKGWKDRRCPHFADGKPRQERPGLWAETPVRGCGAGTWASAGAWRQ